MRLVVLGAGGYGQTVADLAYQSEKYREIYFLDDQKQTDNVCGVCGDYKKFVREDIEMYPAFGNNEVRMQWLDRLKEDGITVPTLIHSTAYVSPRAEISVGTMILPGAIVNTDSKVGRGCIINSGAIVDHGCVIEEGVHVCLNAVIKAENRIPRCMKIEAGEVVAIRTYPFTEKEEK